MADLTSKQLTVKYGAKIVQSAQAVVTSASTTAITTNGTFYSIVGLSCSITPKYSSSVILILSTISGCTNDITGEYVLQLLRGATPIGSGTTVGSRDSGIVSFYDQSGLFPGIGTKQITYIDSPATTSSTTYSFSVTGTTSGIFYLNSSKTDTNSNAFWRSASNIVLLELQPSVTT